MTGFQAAGTRGRAIQEGATEIKFFGKYHRVRAEIKEISSLSAHADYLEILEWLSHFKSSPEKIFLNHGEPHQSDALRTKIQHHLDWKVQVAEPNNTYSLEKSQVLAG